MAWLSDTHGLLWVLFDPTKLRRKVRDLLGDPIDEVSVSPVSYWEISLKYGMGKHEFPNTDPSEIPVAASLLGLGGIALKPERLSTFHRLLCAPNHCDPFDRILIRQAIRRKDILLTKDRCASFFKVTDWKRNGGVCLKSYAHSDRLKSLCRGGL